MSYTIKQLEELKAKRLIKDYQAASGKPVMNENNAVPKKRAEKIKGWIDLQLQTFCDCHRLELKKEFQFDPDRKWRFDWAVPSKKIAFEYEGLSSRKNGHTSKKGYTDNTEKYNEASAQGWRLFRYTFLNYKQLNNDLNKIL